MIHPREAAVSDSAASPTDRLAIVIPTLSRPEAAQRVLSDVLAQLRDGDEVVVVDQSDAPDRERLAAFCAQHARIRHLPRSRRSLPAARNAGVRASTAPIVLFFDDDVRLHPGCLDGHRAAYRDPSVGGVVGRIVERVLRPNARRTTNRIDRGGRIRTRLDGDVAVDIETLKGANMSLRRRALAEAGPFDPGYAGTALLEDADLSTRVRALGWRLRYEPRAGVDHEHHDAGGVRVGRASAWRLHNTAYFVRRHRARRDLPLVLATSAAVALRVAVRERDPLAVGRLAVAFARGWRAGGVPLDAGDP